MVDIYGNYKICRNPAIYGDLCRTRHYAAGSVIK